MMNGYLFCVKNKNMEKNVKQIIGAQKFAKLN